MQDSLVINPSLGLPAHYTKWREDQFGAVDAVVKSTKPVFLLDAPTGVGKSLLAIGAQRILRRQTIYITRTKQLQDQIMRDFSEIAVSLKGKSNYPCAMKYNQFPEVTADDCGYRSPGKQCEYFDDCEYHIAKESAKHSQLVVLNDAYFLAEANGDRPSFGDNGMLVVDEVDSIENGLLSYIQFEITLSQIQKYGLQLPSNPDSKQSWLDWMPGVVSSLSPWVRDTNKKLNEQDPSYWGPMEIEMKRQVKRTEKLLDKLLFLRREVDGAWVFYPETKHNGDKQWVFKPVQVGKYGDEYLWSHGQRALGMSGTIFDAGITCRDLGIQDCDYMKLDSPFPVANRPVYYKPISNLTYKTMDFELPILTKEIHDIIARYPTEKGLIHTVSYKVRDYLLNNLPDQGRLMTHTSQTRETSLAEFKASNEPKVMLSPSFDRGVDLPVEDNVGFVIVCKMPFMSISDPQTKARMALPDGGKWYALKTAQTLIQMCGRHIRSNRQKGDTWVLDRQFGRLRSQLASTLPAWWTKAVIDVPLDKRPDQMI
jgi:ATP-dependent DNA helicase DinG